jgi:membrane peptidoglycan carboxypeptidase
MKDVVRRGTAAGSVGSQFHIPSGGKTGTTNDGTDVWYIGYTSDLLAGVWIGLDRPQKIKSNAQGGVLAAPAWTAFMTEVYQRKPTPPDWPRPAGIVTKTVDLVTNTEWTPGCPGVPATEVFIAGTEPAVPCSMTSNLITDTTGAVMTPGLSTPGTSPAYPPTRTAQPRDTFLSNMPPNPHGGRDVPGATPLPRAASPKDTVAHRPIAPPPIQRQPLDTSRARRDSVKPPVMQQGKPRKPA